MAVHSTNAVFYTAGLTQTADPEQSYGPKTTDLCNDTVWTLYFSLLLKGLWESGFNSVNLLSLLYLITQTVNYFSTQSAYKMIHLICSRMNSCIPYPYQSVFYSLHCCFHIISFKPLILRTVIECWKQMTESPVKLCYK